MSNSYIQFIHLFLWHHKLGKYIFIDIVLSIYSTVQPLNFYGHIVVASDWMPHVFLKSLCMCPCQNIALTSKGKRGSSFWSQMNDLDPTHRGRVPQTLYSNVVTVSWNFFVNKKEQKEVINQGTFQVHWWERRAGKGSSKAGGGVWLSRLPAVSLRCYLKTLLLELVEANGLLNSKSAS